MFYLRKIEEKQWNGKILYDSVSISDLKTLDNDISVWQDDGTSGLNIKFALAFSLCTGRISDLWCVNIPDNKLNSFQFHKVPSITPYIPMRNLHTNIILPTICEMGKIAKIIYDIVAKNGQIYISEREIKECFYDAIVADEIEINFNDKKYRPYRKSLAEIEQIKGKIDFSNLHNAIEVKNDSKTCPTCKGKGIVKI